MNGDLMVQIGWYCLILFKCLTPPLNKCVPWIGIAVLVWGIVDLLMMQYSIPYLEQLTSQLTSPIMVSSKLKCDWLPKQFCLRDSAHAVWNPYCAFSFLILRTLAIFPSGKVLCSNRDKTIVKLKAIAAAHRKVFSVPRVACIYPAIREPKVLAIPL